MPYRVRGKSMLVPVKALHPNPWNPNKMSQRALEAAKESIEEHGFVDELLVREHQEHESEFEIIDGEHRQEIVEALIEDDPEALIPIRVIDADDAEAKKLTVIMNETRGSADKVELANLLADLSESYGDDVGIGLPYTENELNELIELASHDWDQYDENGYEENGGEEGSSGGEWVVFEVRMTVEDYEAYTQAKQRIEEVEQLTGERQTQNGQVIAALVAEYISSLEVEV